MERYMLMDWKTQDYIYVTEVAAWNGSLKLYLQVAIVRLWTILNMVKMICQLLFKFFYRKIYIEYQITKDISILEILFYFILPFRAQF